MNRIIIFGIITLIVLLYGCNSEDIAFKKGVKRLNEIDEKFGTNMKTVPDSMEEINEMYAQLVGLSATNQERSQALEYLLDFRIKSLEAEKLHIEGWQWGRGSTTDYGFGCRRGSARILNSSKIRNSSAYKGFEAIEALKLFVDKFPDKAKSLNLTQKDALFLNAAYQQVDDKARRDSRIIRNLCKEQVEALSQEGII